MPSPPPQSLGPHHLRLFALLLDYLFVVAALNLGQQVLLGAAWDLRPPPPGLWAEIGPRLTAGVLLFALRDVPFGVGPGKWLMGIAVHRADSPGSAPPRLALALRQITVPLLPLEALWVFVDPYARRLGDRLAGTVVVAVAEPAPIGRRMLVFTALLLAALLAGLLVAPWNMRRSAAIVEAERIVMAEPETQRLAGPGAAWSDPARFHLDLQSQPPRAAIRFSASGSLGKAEGELVLVLAESPRRWVRESLTWGTPPLVPSDAPPPPKPR